MSMTFFSSASIIGPSLGNYTSICDTFRSYVQASPVLCSNWCTKQLQCSKGLWHQALIFCLFKSPLTLSSTNNWKICNFSALLLAYCFILPSRPSHFFTEQKVFSQHSIFIIICVSIIHVNKPDFHCVVLHSLLTVYSAVSLFSWTCLIC